MLCDVRFQKKLVWRPIAELEYGARPAKDPLLRHDQRARKSDSTQLLGGLGIRHEELVGILGGKYIVIPVFRSAGLRRLRRGPLGRARRGLRLFGRSDLR